MPPRSSSPPSKSLPQPIETSKGTNRRAKDRSAEENPEEKPTRRAWPHPVEKTGGTSRRGDKSLDTSSASSTEPSRPLPRPIETTTSTTTSGRFAPQMVETSRRSRRNTDENVGMPDEDQSDDSASGGSQSSRRRRRKRPDIVPCPPINTPACSTTEVPQLPPESNFSSTKLAEKQQRRHSFRIPDLPSIVSSETEEESNASDDPSLTRTTSAESDPTRRSGSRKRKKTYPIATRDSEDERYQGYLLTLAASAAERQLRDQAMAAYPNENVYEPVHHYAGDADSEPDSDTDVHVGKLAVEDRKGEDSGLHAQRGHRQRRRDSGAGWDMAEMRSHQAKLDDQRQKAWLSGAGVAHEKQPELAPRKGSMQQNQRDGPQTRGGIVGYQKDNESAAMRKAAAPPMAGRSLVFAKCMSPQQTRVDVHQYHSTGSQKQTPAQSGEHTGLWTPASRPGTKNSQAGLWMGVNAATAQSPTPSPALHTGLVTPARERSDPFSTSSRTVSRTASPSSRKNSRNRQAGLAMTSIITSPVAERPPTAFPPTPPASVRSDQQQRNQEDTKRSPTDEDLRREFPDSFVTQVYNYLSLGYPVLARPYDDELARITRTEITRLRRDDENAAAIATNDLPSDASEQEKKRAYARGYVGVPEGTGADARGADKGAGERWRALRLYVWEWGRQQRGIWDEEADEDGDEREKGDVVGEETVGKKGVGLGTGVAWSGGGMGNRKSSWGW